MQPLASLAQPVIRSGVYGVGSRYILVANTGNRVCYQGVSGISGRYAIAVGETTGSLSSEGGKFVIDGWKNQYGRTLSISQGQKGIIVTFENGDNAGDSVEYGYYEPFRNDWCTPVYTQLMSECLNSSGEFFKTNPDYTIRIPKVSSQRISQSGESCQDAVNRTKSKLERANSRIGTAIVSEHSYKSYPEGRRLEYVMGIGGSGAVDVLRSPVFLRSIADDIISQCRDIGLFSIGLDRSEISRSYGIMYDGSVKEFQCIEDAFDPRTRTYRYNQPLSWGIFYSYSPCLP
jgi:hypothetical protein